LQQNPWCPQTQTEILKTCEAGYPCADEPIKNKRASLRCEVNTDVNRCNDGLADVELEALRGVQKPSLFSICLKATSSENKPTIYQDQFLFAAWHETIVAG